RMPRSMGRRCDRRAQDCHTAVLFVKFPSNGGKVCTLLHQGDSTMLRVTCIVWFSFLATFCAGCGKQVDTGKAPEHAEQAATTSEKAQEPRIESGQSAPASPWRTDDRPTAQPIAAGPATLGEILKVADLRQMPRPENAEVKIASPA